jgi:MarR family transcriptional regulator, organic hydroperoxide resistance regulator
LKEKRKGGFLLAKVHQLSGRIFARMLKEHGIDEINPAQGRILFVLWEKDAIPIRELSERTRLEKSTLSAMLDRLEKSGFIRRKPSSTDRRKILITRTDKDRSFQKAYEKVSDRMIDLFYKGFKPVEINRFECTLERILDNLDNSK